MIFSYNKMALYYFLYPYVENLVNNKEFIFKKLFNDISIVRFHTLIVLPSQTSQFEKTGASTRNSHKIAIA